MSKAYLWQLENEEDKQPSAEILYRIASVLGVTIVDLLDKPVRVASMDSDNLPESLRQLVEERGEELDIQEDDIKMLLSVTFTEEEAAKMVLYSVPKEKKPDGDLQGEDDEQMAEDKRA